MKNTMQAGLWLLFLTGIAILGYNIYLKETTPPTRTYTVFMSQLKQGKIKKVHLRAGKIVGEDIHGQRFSSFSPDVSALMPLLDEHHVEISAEAPASGSMIDGLKSLIPLFLILGAWFLFTRNTSGSGLGKDKSTRFIPVTDSSVTFKDVAGISEARTELKEIVDFLKYPEKFSRLGGHIPKGVLLQGPPGTGKTLLAKAIAGEASVPFYSMSGSDFVEMFVGVGASRVRELFTEAKKKAPCIIFIDEIDAIGGRRSGGAASGGGDEREQTLNALLVEMDGFRSNETIIVVAATNRPDILDPALLRPGRFDRQVTISIPDIKGRIKILEVHVKNIVAGKNINLPEISRSIPGFSGADIANLVNEAALMASRKGKKSVDMEDFENAKDKIVMGIERKNAVISEENRRITAYHEAGHAIVAKLLPETDPLHKITIIPRGRALGSTQQIPIDDRLTYSKEYILNRIKILMGGRVAEEQIFDRLTTGASNDILSATELATRLVCEWGMSDVIGPVAYIQEQGSFLGNQSIAKQFSEQTARLIDAEVKRIISECYQETVGLMKKNNKFLHKLAEALLVNETVDAEEVDIVLHCYLKEKKMEEDMKKSSAGQPA
jgi:cell division protease FtsH